MVCTAHWECVMDGIFCCLGCSPWNGWATCKGDLRSNRKESAQVCKAVWRGSHLWNCVDYLETETLLYWAAAACLAYGNPSVVFIIPELWSFCLLYCWGMLFLYAWLETPINAILPFYKQLAGNLGPSIGQLELWCCNPMTFKWPAPIFACPGSDQNKHWKPLKESWRRLWDPWYRPKSKLTTAMRKLRHASSNPSRKLTVIMRKPFRCN